MTTTMVDLSDPELYRSGSPEQAWARLRAESPVYRNPGPANPFWAVLTHDLITEVLKDTSFTSEKGMQLDHNPAATAASAGKMLIITDPPRHGSIRRVMNSAFTPKMVRRLEENMRQTVRETLTAYLAEGTCDLTRLASRLPLAVICDMLGVPRPDWDFMLDRTMVAFGAVSGVDPWAAAEAHADILTYYDKLIALRRKDPQDDVITALANGEVDGRPLTDEEIFLNCDGLISGGNETTRHATVAGVLALMGSPGQWQMLRDDPGLLGTAVQEVLRVASPAMHVLRTATEDREIGGQQIRAGDRVTVWLPSGNRDERVFNAPNEFDITRSPNRHLTFASGTHFCLGSALATMELTVLFDEFVRRMEVPEPAGPVLRMRSNLIWGFESVPVTLTPR